ncbi:arginyl-tRNA synthetase (ArgS) [Candidatus Glomeribacter gigasporarum BEG34]|uniref:Arginine--tRNA ligase n=1 Tax=Candidatus Glomeribacter gigasporarum BEG34 TaxID=1070319 RepID=G2J9W2_9BURK|nr:arginine--tRNA ligase [Candidatus Glomeribacter gigasporarum]CCD29559.1 arginyl-tRNA synthetase (ArgS) [Candidatus Glomeribacter gigasporarum BEG34]
MLPAQTQIIEAIFTDAVRELAHSAPSSDATDISITLERPKIAAHGDLASTVALQQAKAWGVSARRLAQQLADAVQAHPRACGLIESVEVAGPGFINVRISAQAKQTVVAQILAQKAQFGWKPSTPKGRQRVLIEFVSANPTGPLHVGHARQAVLGDVLANLLATQGWQVQREYYYNDAGVQIQNLALSVAARARGLQPGDAGWPDAAYHGEYIADIARDYLMDEEGKSDAGDANALEHIRLFAVAYLRREQDADLQALGVRFDQYYLESSLYRTGRVDATVQALCAAGKTYMREGALWLKTTEEGDDKDRVMRKSDGSYTYFVPDIAYHLTKWERGFTRAINVQGADHHGTVARVRGGLQQLARGAPKGYPEYVLHKMVTVVRDGQEVKLSKRAGAYVTVRDLIEWSGARAPTEENALLDEGEAIRRGRDAVRFFLASRRADTEFVFDVDLAAQQNDQNPVYYVQYAHARICSVLAQWGGEEERLINADVTVLTSESERALLSCLADYPDLLRRAADELAPHMLTFYLRALASCFHSFYNAERILVDEALRRTARIALIAATRQVLANGLAVVGVRAPVKM